jgi:ABC-type transport system involved in multi-copper enzyme maturation permease subunit
VNAQDLVARAQKWSKEQPWRLFGSQVSILVRNEIRRNLFTRRRIGIYVLALVPALIILTHVIFDRNQPAGPAQLEGDTQVLAGIIQLYYFRLGIFFACMAIFTWLFRGEMVERTLHYQFLVPVRREVLVVGKFLAGSIVVIALFEIAVFACFYLMYSRFGSLGKAYVFGGPGLGQLESYLLVTALACLGYGAVFLALSMLFKNPIVPGVVILGWETIAPIFPAWAQLLSITFYLKHLCPVSLPLAGPLAIFTIVAEPVSPFIAVFGLLCLTIAILALSCFLIHRMEITYTAE